MRRLREGQPIELPDGRGVELLGRCCECRAGEHGDFSDVREEIITVRDIDTNRIVQRGRLCEDHIDMRLTDGFALYAHGRRIEP